MEQHNSDPQFLQNQGGRGYAIQKNVWAIGFMVFVVLTGVCNAQAPVPRAEDAIRYRRAVMVMIKWHYDRLSLQTKGSIPFVREEAQRSTAWLETLSQQAAEGLPAAVETVGIHGHS